MSTFCLVALIASASHLATTQDAANEVHRSFEAQDPVQSVYPPLARAARIMGDVRVRVSIRPDGSVISAEVLDGPAMLRDAALASAKQSKFFCWPECTDAVTTAVVTYTYGTRLGSCCCDAVQQRSWKCLNLWRCGKWKNVPGSPPTIGILPNRIVILADAMCVETQTGRTRAMR